MNIEMTSRLLNRSRFEAGATVANYINSLRNRMKDKRDARALRSLDPRTLRDMGIDRSEIISVIYSDNTERRISHARN